MIGLKGIILVNSRQGCVDYETLATNEHLPIVFTCKCNVIVHSFFFVLFCFFLKGKNQAFTPYISH